MSEPDYSPTIDIAVDDLAAMVRLLRGSGIEVSEPTPGVDGGYATLRGSDGTEVRLHPAAFGSGSVSSTDDNAVRALPPDFHPAGEADAGPRRRNVSALLLPIVLLVAATVAFLAIRESPASGPDASGSEDGTSAEPPTAAGDADTATATAEAGQESAERAGPIAGIAAPWDVFALGDDTVARIDFANGQVTMTELPGSTSRQSSLIVGRHRVLVATGRQGRSYMVADGAAERAPDALANLQRGLPGPEPGQLWVKRGRTYELFNLAGERLGKSINLPESGRYSWGTSDGSGHVLIGMRNGYYVASPEGVRRITPGVLLAIGPSAALVRECDDRARCERVVIDRTDGSRRVLPSGEHPVSAGPLGMGKIAPNGKTAAIRMGPRVTFIDLRSGTANVVDMMPPDGTFHGSSGAQKLAWAPEGKWVFLATDNRLVAIDMATRLVHNIELPLDTVHAIAIRAGG